MDPSSHTGNASTASSPSLLVSNRDAAQRTEQDTESGCLSGTQKHQAPAEAKLDRQNSTTAQSELSSQLSESQNEAEQLCPQHDQQFGLSQGNPTPTGLSHETEKMKLQEEQTKPLTVIPPESNKQNQGKPELDTLDSSVEEQTQEPLTPDCGCPLEEQQNLHRPLDEQLHQDSHLSADPSSPEEQLNQVSCHQHKKQQIRHLDHNTEKWNDEESDFPFEDALDKDRLPCVQPLDVEFSLCHPLEENTNLCDQGSQNQVLDFMKDLEMEDLSFLDQQNQDLQASEKQQTLECDSFLLDLKNQTGPSLQDLENQDPCPSLCHQNPDVQVSETQQKLDRSPGLLGLQNQEPPEHQEKQDSPSLQDLQNQEPVPPPPLEQQNQDLHTSEKPQTQDYGPSLLDLQNQESPKHEKKQDSPSLQDSQNQDPGAASLDQRNQDLHPSGKDTQTQHCDPSLSDPPPEHHDKQDDGNAQLNSQQPLHPAEDQKSASLQVSSVSDNSTKSPLPTSPTTTQLGDRGQPVPQVPSPDEPKLCGFLQKQGGPLRAWKQRWFTYEEKKNQLFYYRTPQDVMPLGHVDLSSATFTYPLKAEDGTFHIKTPERTFVLKAVTQELMLYWLQQLQVKRWQHRQTTSCPETMTAINNNNADDFLPLLKSPVGLVGEEAANVQSQRRPLTNMSIKHPLIELQNSVHFLRKRSSQELSQSVFHVETPGSPKSAHSDNAGSRTSVESPPPTALLPDPTEGKTLPFLTEAWSKKARKSSSSTMPVHRRDTLSSSSDRISRIQQEKQMLMEEVKAQKELVWILHKALEAAQLEKRACTEFLAEENEQKRLELLRHRERQSADLQRRLEEANMEAELLRRSSTEKDTQVAELQELVRMLTEKNNAKQEVIIKLSNQMTTFMSNQQPSPAGGALTSDTLKRFKQENENLKDDIEAYKIQNRFLNSEIYQLTRLWRNSSEQERSLMVKCAYLEASNCQVESRYLGVLKRLQEIKTLDPVQRQAVHKMIEDALKGEIKSVVKLNTTRDHDEYGFKIIPDYEVEDMKLLAKIQALEIRSHNLLQQDTVERPLLTRWAQYLAGRSNDDLCASPELKSLLRSGVPQEYRQRVWSWMVQTRTRTIRDRHPQHYQQLCEKSQTCHSPAFRQIQLDLHRTLTTNQRFSSPSSATHQQLCRILQAFSWHNPAIGYCQGLNRLAAIALLVLQNEEESFWCLVAVIESIMPQEYYTKNLLSSQADQRVLKDFLQDKLPRLASHFEEFSIDVSLVTFNWFLVVFVENLPSDILLPLWDAFLYEGSKVMFRYALALFKYKENDILKIHDSVEIHQYLRFFTKTITDSRKLISIAFNDLNPFPGRLLKNRRALHMERLQAELRELEEQQREFVTESAERKDKDLDTMVSEDDEDL